MAVVPYFIQTIACHSSFPDSHAKFCEEVVFGKQVSTSKSCIEPELRRYHLASQNSGGDGMSEPWTLPCLFLQFGCQVLVFGQLAAPWRLFVLDRTDGRAGSGGGETLALLTIRGSNPKTKWDDILMTARGQVTQESLEQVQLRRRQDNMTQARHPRN